MVIKYLVGLNIIIYLHPMARSSDFSRGQFHSPLPVSPKGTFGSICRHFLLSQLGWAGVRGVTEQVEAREAVGTPHHGTAPTTRSVLPQMLMLQEPRHSAPGFHSHLLHLRLAFPLCLEPFLLPCSLTLLFVQATRSLPLSYSPQYRHYFPLRSRSPRAPPWAGMGSPGEVLSKYRWINQK